MSSDGSLRVGPWALGAGAVLGGTLLVGRLSGLAREVQLAATFGVSAQADAAVLLLTLPDLLVNLLLSGGLSAALVPRLRALPVPNAQALLRQTLLFVFMLFGLFAAMLVALPGVWFSVLAPGLPAESLPPVPAVLATSLAIPLAAVSGVTTAGLNAQQRFLVAGCGTLIFNIAVIGALAAVQHGVGLPLVMLGVGIAAGATLRLLTQLISLPRDWLLGSVFQTAVDTKFLRGFFTAALTTSLILLVPVIVRALASTVTPGAIAALNYATKLVELPAGVLVTSLATVALARLSEHHGRGDTVSTTQVFQDGVRRSLCNAIGAGLLIAYFANTFVELALGRGAMEPSAVARVVGLTQILMTGLPFLALSSMAIADLNAKETPSVVLRATLWCLLLVPLLALPGMWLGSEKLLAWAIVVFQILHAFLLVRSSGLTTSDVMAWWDGKLAKALLIVVGILAITFAADQLLNSLELPNSFAQFVLASGSIVALVALPQRAIALK